MSGFFKNEFRDQPFTIRVSAALLMGIVVGGIFWAGDQLFPGLPLYARLLFFAAPAALIAGFLVPGLFRALGFLRANPK